MKRLLAAILIIIFAFSIASCSKNEENGSESSGVPAGDASNNDTSYNDESYKNVLHEDDTYLMTIEVDGEARYICLNNKLEIGQDSPLKEYPFALLTDADRTINPTLVREGDTFMNWKVAEVSAYFLSLDDGRMYPTSRLHIKLEGDVTFTSAFTYYRSEMDGQDYLNINMQKENFVKFPYPVYTHPSLSLDFIHKMYDVSFDVKNAKEIADSNNLRYGNYEGEIKVKHFYIDYEQPSRFHYYSLEIERIKVSSEKLKTDSSKGEAYNAAITAYNEFLNGEKNAVSRDKKQTITINSIGNSAGDPSIISYALFDVNGDGIPELHARSLHYYIFSYQDNQVVLWHKDTLNFWLPEEFPPEEGGAIGEGSANVLENGAIFSYTVDENGRKYSYTTFDANGNPTTLNFSDPTQYSGQKAPADAVYTFDNKIVTKEEYDKKTKEYFELENVYLKWKNYVNSSDSQKPATSEQSQTPTTTFMPDQSYVGRWYSDAIKTDSLDIFEINDKITFEMSKYRLDDFAGTAELKDNHIVFVGYNGSHQKITGILVFQDNQITLTITNSDAEYFYNGETFVFRFRD
mgnify:FL=1